jgi:muramoyltetrapeptide carboxypeptidase
MEHLPQEIKTIGILSTAKAIQYQSIAPSIEWLEASGFKTVVGETIGQEWGPFAGNDELRAKDFIRMLKDPKIDAIWMARGGYGTLRVLSQIDPRIFKLNPKQIFGFSDITVLHAFLNTRLGLPSVHSMMPIQFSESSQESKDSLLNCFKNKRETIVSSKNSLNRKGEAKGIITGGNLSILASLSGTSYDWDSTGKILFIEEVDEWVYHIDRMLLTLDTAGKLKHLSAIMVGGLTDIKDNEAKFPYTVSEIVNRYAAKYDLPVAHEIKAGHQHENLAIPMGVLAEIKVDQNGSELAYL